MTFDPRMDLSLDDFLAHCKQQRARLAPAYHEPAKPVRPSRSRSERIAEMQAGEHRARKKARARRRSARENAKRCDVVPGIETLALDPCAYCDDAHPTTHDHIVPFSKGGEHDLGNLTRCCWRCNFEKATRSLVVFLALRAIRRAAVA